MKAYEAIASALVEEECGAIFGLMGEGNMLFWNILGRDDGKVRIYLTRHEAAAVAMADGYSRATGRIGVATVTYGPGLTQVGTSLMVASRNRSSLVLLAGDIPRGSKSRTSSMNQRGFAEACGARFHAITSSANLADEIAETFYASRLHRQPVVLSLPIDVQEQDLEWEWEYRSSKAVMQDGNVAPNADAVLSLAEALIQSKRPVIIAGRGARTAREEIVKLADRVGALLATSLQAKNWFSDHPYDIGIAGAFSSAPSEQLLADADFVLGVGAEVGLYTSEGGLLFPQASVARIDIKSAPDEIGATPGLFVHGDAARTVAALNEILERQRIQKEGFRTSSTRKVLEARPVFSEKPTDGLDPRSLAGHLSKALPKGALVTCGMGHFFSFLAMYLTLPQDGEMHFSYQFDAIGQTLPLSTGIGIGSPGRPHIAIEGDGSLMMYLQELDTLVRYRVPLVLIVWNDGGYGAEVHKLRAKGLEPRLAQWKSPNFVSLARSFGGDGVRLKAEHEIVDAVNHGLGQGGLFLIDAPVSPTTISDPFRKLFFGQANQAPLLRRQTKHQQA